MEPITWAWFLLAALSGIVGNRTDQLFTEGASKGFKTIVNYFQQGNVPNNQELQKATTRAFLLAQQSIVSDCRQELESQRSSSVRVAVSSQDREWIYEKERQLKRDLKQLNQEQLSITPISSPQEIQDLLLLGDDLSKNSINSVRERLKLSIRQDNPPLFYLQKVEQIETGLFERMCAFFADEIRNKPVLVNVLQTFLLRQINNNLSNLQITQLTVQDLEDTFRDFAKHLPQILAQLDTLEELIKSVNENQDEIRENLINNTEILELINNNSESLKQHIEEIKNQIKAVSQQRNASLFSQSGWQVRTVNQAERIIRIINNYNNQQKEK
ncbi:hypothetical protein [Anabaena azotica]|uniref:Uncharacterized protein n=1 Tax=Anabaena azotica FACHB-119 TaxID=947527 RepID=A0ABR8D529_9NOST|nr:hypothetical protein [Anabaena azotica]MBD2501581.1 hypothetical protein [Anabaena azotica FACHB-119]